MSSWLQLWYILHRIDILLFCHVDNAKYIFHSVFLQFSFAIFTWALGVLYFLEFCIGLIPRHCVELLSPLQSLLGYLCSLFKQFSFSVKFLVIFGQFCAKKKLNREFNQLLILSGFGVKKDMPYKKTTFMSHCYILRDSRRYIIPCIQYISMCKNVVITFYVLVRGFKCSTYDNRVIQV